MNATDSTNWRYSADNNERATENGKDRAVPDKNHKSHRVPFALGEVQVYPSRNEMCARGESVRLQPKVMDVLCYLAQHHERVISNDELIAQVWSGRIVTHGSVQKSINLLRKALSELVGEQEFVTHYSKKGYQLQVTPVVLASEPNEHHSDRARRLRQLALAALALSLGIVGVYLYTIRHTLLIPVDHRTDFATVRAYTSEVGHERAGEPHPDNQHMVYVRERFTGDGAGTESELVIRDGQGDDWVLAGSAGSWVDLAWSPGGKQLAAVELIYEAGPLLRPNQNVRAPLLYDVHVFSVDLRTQMVNETHRLSQWQGRINSITWWDDNTLELVATQGHGALSRRYRYAVQSQRLSPLESLDFVANPLISKVHNGLTAVASLHDGRTRVDFLRRDQSRFASQPLEAAATDLSWVPDGSGVLAHAPDQQSLTLVRRDGRTQSLFLPYRADTWLSTPRYSADGNRLFFTEERPQTPLWRHTLAGVQEPVIQNPYLNYGARFSPDGERFVYLSVRNNQTQIWLVDNERERQLFRHHGDDHIHDLLWTPDDLLVYTVGDHMVVADPKESELTRAHLNGAAALRPLTYRASTQDVVVLNRTGDVDNLWRLNIATGQDRQLTFGAVATAVGDQDAVYFQYVGQSGLWLWRSASGELEQLTPSFTRDSQLLALTADGLFYTVGDRCRESDIYFFRFADQKSTRYMTRGTVSVSTNAFHPDQGALYTPCDIVEADIMMLE